MRLRHTPKSINTLLTPLDVNHGFTPLAGVDLINHNPNANPNAPGRAEQQPAEWRRMRQTRSACRRRRR